MEATKVQIKDEVLREFVETLDDFSRSRLASLESTSGRRRAKGRVTTPRMTVSIRKFSLQVCLKRANTVWCARAWWAILAEGRAKLRQGEYDSAQYDYPSLPEAR